MQNKNKLKQKYRKWLSFTSILTALSMVTVGGLVVGLNTNQQQSFYNLSTTNLNNDVELASNKDARTVLPTNFDGTLKNDSTIIFPETSTTIINSNQMVTTPKGVFITYNNSPAVLLDANTNEIIWKLKKQDGTDSVLGSNSSFRILCTKYNPNISPEGSDGGSLLIFSMGSGSARLSGSFLLSLVDADTGMIYAQQTINPWHRYDSSDFSAYLYPIQNTTDQYLLISRGNMETNYRRETMLEITISSSGINVGSPISAYDPNSNKSHTIFSAGAFKVGDDVYLAQVEWWGGWSYGNTGDVYFSVYKNYRYVFQDKIFSNLDRGEMWYDNFNIPEIKIKHLGDSQYALFALFRTYVNGGRPRALCYTWDISNNSYTRKYDVDLNIDGADYDIQTGYYDSTVDKFITYCSYAKPLPGDRYSGPTVVVFDLNDIDNSDFSLNGGQVRVFVNRSDDAFSNSGRTNSFFPILTTYGNFEESNILLTKSNWTSYALFDISKYSNDTWKNYHYAYWTRPKVDTMPIENVADVNLLGMDSSTLNRAYRSQFLKYFTQYTPDSTQAFIAGNYEGNSGSPSAEYLTSIYQGIAPVSLYCTGIVYDENGQYHNVSSGDETYIFNNITLTGFYKWTTDIKVDSLDISNENATNVEYVTQYVKDNVNDIFKDLPLDFDANTNVVSVSLDTTNPLRVGITITLNKWIDQDGIVQTTSKDFSLPGSINFNTYVKDEYLNGEVERPRTLRSCKPQEFYLNDGAMSLNIAYLKSFVGDNFFENINNRKKVEVIDLVFGDFDNAKGTLVIKKAIITNYYDSGVFFSGDDFAKEIELNTTITNFSTASTTTIQSELPLPENTNYNVKNISDQQIVDLINNAADELVQSKFDGFAFANLPTWNKQNNFFVDASSIVRDTTNNTVSINVATNCYYAGEKAVYTTFPYLTQTVTISGFNPIGILATTINEVQLDQNGGIFSVENSPLASLNVNNITGNEAELLQFIIDSNIFENLPDQFTIQNIVDVTIDSRDDGSIAINSITINKYLNETGGIVEENKTFSDLTIVLQGFSGPQLEIGNSTYLNAPISGDTTIASDLLPSALDEAQTKEALIALLNANKSKFMSLPETITTFDDTNVLVVDQVVDNKNGTLAINFTLSTLLINGQLVDITQEDVNDISNDFIFSATLTGFKTLNLWEGLDLTIDFAGNNIYDFVNNGELTPGFDYIAAIKENLITYLDAFGEDDTINPLKEYINSEEFADPSHFSVNYNYNDLQNSTIVVSDTQLDTLSGSSMWSNGVVFNVTNASYLITEATLKSDYDPTNGGVNTLSQFKADIANVNISDVASFNNLPIDNFSTTDYSNPDLITLSVVNEKDHTAQLAITFKSYFDENGVINDYTLVFDEVFTFASEQDDQSVSLVDSVDAMDIGVDTYNSYQLVTALNESNVSDVNTWLEGIKDLIVDPSTISTENLTLTFDNAIVNNTNNNQVIITVLINDNQYQTFTITNLTPITSTNITVSSEIAPDVNASNINSYFDTDVNEKAKSFIDWNTDSKLPFVDETVATVISAQVFNLTLNSDGTYQVYINFIFNGVYLSINDNITYASNYLYQIMINNLPATSSVSNSATRIIATNNTDHFIDINNQSLSTTKNNNLPIILIATLLPIVLLILLSVIICMFYIRHKNKK